MKGHLFVFEGADGVGKTSIINQIYTRLIERGLPIKRFSFPGTEQGTLGHLIYDIHNRPLSYNITSIDPASLQLLHIAAHIDSINRCIIPALNANNIVLLDRYWWSTLIYGKIEGISETALNKMIELEKECWKTILPDKLFLLKRIKTPLKHGINVQQWNNLIKEYALLSSLENQYYPIFEIVNESTLEIASNSILEEILKMVLEF